ncbi:hypothetical protein MCOR29_004822 [Pyricularia oryzae]|nr:hypothetical protein MCOR29_004822 [Pyricularia oryzae]
MAVTAPVLAAPSDPGSPVSVFDFPSPPASPDRSEHGHRHYTGRPRVHARSDPGSPVSVFDFPSPPASPDRSENRHKHYAGRPKVHFRA